MTSHYDCRYMITLAADSHKFEDTGREQREPRFDSSFNFRRVSHISPYTSSTRLQLVIQTWDKPSHNLH